MEALLQALGALTGSWAIPAAFLGVLWGILGGALPGISPSIAMAILLPMTYGMQPVTAMVLLASVYVGAEYGGSIPAILIRTPGTNSAAATTVDGYEMARQGRAGEALGISLVAGLVGGLFGSWCWSPRPGRSPTWRCPSRPWPTSRWASSASRSSPASRAGRC
jgi:putative tricarboxylic transport membrane protein